MRVLALAPYPARIASTRFRISQFVPLLARRGIDVEFVPWLDDHAAARLYAPQGFAAAAASAVRGSRNQLSAIMARRWDVVWIQREAALAGPPIAEALAMRRGIPVVLDYDDAVWIAQGSAAKRAMKFAWKFDWVLRRSAHAIAGSNALAARAARHGTPATVVPTTVERDRWTPRSEAGRPGPPIIGWIGSHSTASQLELVAPALRRLRSEGHEFRLVVIGAPDGFRLDGVSLEIRRWSLEHEVDDFRSLDIGLAPMHESPWHEGKCGFKQIQYMAVGVPCVSSLVGGARDFVVDGENALVAASGDDWYAALHRLLEDPALRATIAASGRRLVDTRLCAEEQAAVVDEALRAAAATTRAARP